MRMKLLLQLEWGKLRKYRTFWVFLILFAVTLTGINAVLYSAQERLLTASAGQADLHLFSPERLWSTTAWASGFSVLVLGLLLIVLVTNEFSFKTHRQEVMEGLTRGQFMAAKWMVAGGLMLYAWVLYVIVTLIIGSLNDLSPGDMTSGIRFGGYFLLKIAVSFSIALIFALWLKRSGLAIVLYLLYVLLLEGILGFVLNRVTDGLGDFLPLKSTGTLISNPAAHLLPGGDYAYVAPWLLVLVAVAYLVIFITGSIVSFRRADL